MADPVNGAAVGDEMDAEQDNPSGGVTYLCGGQYVLNGFHVVHNMGCLS